MIYPHPLCGGEKIAVISPATTVKREYVEGAAARLRDFGFEPVIFPHALGPASGSYASAPADRLADFVTAWNDRSIAAVLCARGGYGCMELLGAVPPSMLRLNPKWLAGFSDVSALHAMLLTAGVASLHAPMAKHLALEEPSDRSTQALLAALTSSRPIEYRTPRNQLDISGEASGQLRGGNLAVLNGLAATSFDILRIGPADDVILFLEDIAEPIYKVERVMRRLRLTGALNRVKGIIFGQFTEYRPDLNFPSMEAMLAARVADWGLEGIPVAFGYPVGHVRENLTLIEGSQATLTVGADGVTLKMEQK